MLTALVALKDQVAPDVKTLIETCEGMGVDCPFIPNLYAQCETQLKELEDAKAEEVKQQELIDALWDSTLKEFKKDLVGEGKMPAVGNPLDWGFGILGHTKLFISTPPTEEVKVALRRLWVRRWISLQTMSLSLGGSLVV